MRVTKVEKLTNEKWLNLFVASYEHKGHTGRWLYASRKQDPGKDHGLVQIGRLLAAMHIDPSNNQY